MSEAGRRYQIVTTATVMVAWAAFYVAVIATAAPPTAPETAAKVNRELALVLAVPMLLWVVAALLLLHHWWSRAGARMSMMDTPGRPSWSGSQPRPSTCRRPALFFSVGLGLIAAVA